MDETMNDRSKSRIENVMSRAMQTLNVAEYQEADGM